ncbi:MAG: hypothetical protein EOP38_10940 [Rubrivivax sp.]|nr:MAG: hypothetical protein EOP38_10940 [Rubrivivax sp.]
MTSRLSKVAAALVAALGLSQGAWAQYSKVVVFGDSLSDTHRIYEFTKAVFGVGLPPSPPSMLGRFCDGPVAVENLAQKLNAPILNYSFAGSQTGYGTLVLIPWGILTQVNEHLNHGAMVPTITTLPLISDLTSLIPGTGRADPKALYFIWSGPDDFYAPGGMAPKTIETATRNIQQAITSLYNAGARYFFIPTMPDLSITPRALEKEQTQPGYIAKASLLSTQFSDALKKALVTSAAKAPKARIMVFDTLPFLAVEKAKAEAEGKNTTQVCHHGTLNWTIFNTDPPCPDPENYLFWDDNHPSAAANRVLGEAWAKAVVYRP